MSTLNNSNSNLERSYQVKIIIKKVSHPGVNSHDIEWAVGLACDDITSVLALPEGSVEILEVDEIHD